jgi:hypothetical protein
MSEYRDYYIDSMDGSSTGINSALRALIDRMREIDPPLADSLVFHIFMIDLCILR